MNAWFERPTEHTGDKEWNDDAPAPSSHRTIAPGKRTLTMALASRARGASLPVQRVAMPAASRAPAERLEASELDWSMAVRPDLWTQAPEPAASGTGEPMPAPVQAQMEQAFGVDFSPVRIHQDGAAAAMGALAYARGTDIHFAPGHYDPSSRRGLEMLGHELAHTVQQADGRVRATAQAKGVPVNDDDALEREADAMGARAARGEPVFGSGARSVGAQGATHGGAPHRVDRAGLGRAAPVLQRLIHIHDVNQLPSGVDPKATKTHRPAFMKHLRERVLQELDALLGEAFDGTAYIGESKEIFWQVNGLLELIGDDKQFANVETLEALRLEINKYLLAIEEAAVRGAGGEIPRLSLGNVPVGNEFTFTNDTLRNLAATHGSKIQKAKDNERDRAKQAYDRENTAAVAEIIGSWDAHMQKFAAARSKAVDKPFGIVRTEGKDHKGRKVKYEFPSLSWHYDVTVDQGCVEVITPPVPASDLVRGEIADAIDTYIFGVANAVGLQADPTFGGGHINIDRVQGFESGGRNLASFLQGFVDDAAFWKKLDTDEINAPFPDELPGDKAKRMQGILNKYLPLYDAEDADVSAINGRLAAELIRDVFDVNLAGEKKSASPHYQAANLEHFAEENEDERRVEVRRVPAQRSRADLLNELDRLFGLMGGVDVPAEPRFGGGESSQQSSQQSSGASDKPKKLGANDLAPAQGPVLAGNNLVHIPILGDGNCFFNAVIRTAGLTDSMQDLRNELADAVQNARDANALAVAFPFIPVADVDEVIQDLRAPGAYDSLAGDVAPQILAAVRPYTLNIIQGDGTINAVGAGATTLWLVRTTHSVDHYLATRPA